MGASHTLTPEKVTQADVTRFLTYVLAMVLRGGMQGMSNHPTTRRLLENMDVAKNNDNRRAWRIYEAKMMKYMREVERR